jgi:Tubulin-tyrosine ligase family
VRCQLLLLLSVARCSLNRGIGIEVHKDIAAIQAFLQGKAAKLQSLGSHPPGANTYVLQKYIENPVRAVFL